MFTLKPYTSVTPPLGLALGSWGVIMGAICSHFPQRLRSTELGCGRALGYVRGSRQGLPVSLSAACALAAMRAGSNARRQQCAPAAMRAAGGGCGACWARWRPPAFLGQLSFWVLWDSPAGLGLIGCDGKHTGQHATRHTGQHATRHTAEHTAQHAAGHASWHRPYCAQPNPRCDST